jgi:hypothetical protein
MEIYFSKVKVIQKQKLINTDDTFQKSFVLIDKRKVFEFFS